MCPLPVCEKRVKVGVSGAGGCQQNLRLEIRGARGCSQKGGKCQRTHLTDTQATVFYGQTGLQPLCIRKAGFGDAAERRP